MGGGMWGVGFVTVDMRIRKLLKRFLATPMKRWHFLAGIMISRMLFMIPEVLLLLVFARYAFGVVNQGSIAAVALLIVLGAVMFSGIGLLVASRANTIETVTGLMNVVQLPMWIVSGIFFSSERFPDAAQPLIRALPLTALIDSLRRDARRGHAGLAVAAGRADVGLGRRMFYARAALVPLAVERARTSENRFISDESGRIREIAQLLDRLALQARLRQMLDKACLKPQPKGTILSDHHRLLQK